MDEKRIAELRRIMGDEFDEILATLTQSIDTALAQAESALAQNDPQRVAEAAHHCRNDALLLGADDLLRSLASLEHAARRQSSQAAGEALKSVLAVWPPTRVAIMRAGTPGR